MDKTIKCMDCGEDFTLTAGEIDFFQKKGFTEPKRCKKCRAIKKQQRNNFSGGSNRRY